MNHEIMKNHQIHTSSVRMIVAASSTILATDSYKQRKLRTSNLNTFMIKEFKQKSSLILPASFHVEWTIYFALSKEICTVKTHAGKNHEAKEIAEEMGPVN